MLRLLRCRHNRVCWRLRTMLRLRWDSLASYSRWVGSVCRHNHLFGRILSALVCIGRSAANVLIRANRSALCVALVAVRLRSLRIHVAALWWAGNIPYRRVSRFAGMCSVCVHICWRCRLTLRTAECIRGSFG